jgi:hypothetical protein
MNQDLFRLALPCLAPCTLHLQTCCPVRQSVDACLLESTPRALIVTVDRISPSPALPCPAAGKNSRGRHQLISTSELGQDGVATCPSCDQWVLAGWTNGNGLLLRGMSQARGPAYPRCCAAGAPFMRSQEATSVDSAGARCLLLCTAWQQNGNARWGESSAHRRD